MARISILFVFEAFLARTQAGDRKKIATCKNLPSALLSLRCPKV